MIHDDTIKLLRECDAGVRMGITSIREVLDSVKGTELREELLSCQEKHEALDKEIQELLHRYHDEGKEPPVMAKGMSWVKTTMALAMDGSDETVSDLITDGCNMGVKSLSRYLNQYQAADETSKDIAKRLIALEENLVVQIRRFL